MLWCAIGSPLLTWVISWEIWALACQKLVITNQWLGNNDKKLDYLKPHPQPTAASPLIYFHMGLKMDVVMCNWFCFVFVNLGHIMTDLGLGESKNWHRNNKLRLGKNDKKWDCLEPHHLTPCCYTSHKLPYGSQNGCCDVQSVLLCPPGSYHDRIGP
jgi:hypothetical protein